MGGDRSTGRAAIAGPPDDAELTAILSGMRVVLCVGASANPERPSHFVSVYLAQRGIRVIGINPGLAGQQLFGETVRASIAEVPEADRALADTVDVFRRPEDVPAIVQAALEHLPNLHTIWMQIGVAHAGAAAEARAAGVRAVENRCPKVEFPRLLG